MHNKLPYLKQEIKSVNDLKRFFDDPSIFAHEHGDEVEFVKIYNAVSLHFDDLMNMITQIIDPRSLTKVSKACTLCALAEIRYLNENADIVMTAYSSILTMYSEDPNNMLNFLSKS